MKSLNKKMMEMLNRKMFKEKQMKKVASTIVDELLKLKSSSDKMQELIRDVEMILSNLENEDSGDYVSDIQNVKNIGHQFEDALRNLTNKYQEELNQIKQTIED